MAQSILELIFKSSKQGQGGKAAAAEMREVKGTVGEVTQGMLGINVASLTAAGAVVALGSALMTSINAAGEAQQVQAQLNAVIKSTGGAAGLTADDINEMANNLSNLTGAEDDAISKGAAVMLTFTNIGKDVFPQAMKAALDLSAAFGGDLQSSIMQVGKVLNDPSGMGAMKKIGVSFTQAQMDMGKALYETGHIAEYQKIIIDELNKEVGGTAEAMANTYPGKVKKMENAWGNLGEAIGTKFLPAASDTVDYLTRIITMTGQASEAMDQGYGKVAGLGGGYGMLALAQRDAALATEEMRGQMRDANKDLDISAETMEKAKESAQNLGPQVGTLQHYYDIAASSVTGAVDKLKELESLQDQVKAATGELQDAQKNFGQSLASDVASQLESAGLKSRDLKGALGEVDSQMGTNLLSTQQQKEEVKALVDQYARDKDLGAFKQGLSDINDKFEPLDESVKKSTQNVADLNTQLALAAIAVDALNGSKIFIETKYTSSGTPPGGGAPAYNPRGTEPREGASGLDVIVPAGFPNDTAPFMASSGERVIIQTPEQQRNGVGASVVIQQVIIANDMSMAEFEARLRQALRK